MYRAYDVNRDMVVALKRVSKKTRHFSREIQILYALRNEPRCVKMLDFYFDVDKKERKFMQNILFEYIPYNLEKLFIAKFEREEIIRTSTMIYIMEELLLGLIAIHKKNIIHRDIKPDNIFVSEDLSVIKFGDFGASRFQSRLRPGYPTCVSKSYRAP